MRACVLCRGHWGVLDGVEESGLPVCFLSSVLAGGQVRSLSIQLGTCLVMGEGQHTQKETVAAP